MNDCSVRSHRSEMTSSAASDVELHAPQALVLKGYIALARALHVLLVDLPLVLQRIVFLDQVIVIAFQALDLLHVLVLVSLEERLLGLGLLEFEPIPAPLGRGLEQAGRLAIAR